jgi:N-acetylglucosaminyldiphosphoundecaprenol N-acetyl-beta-D-mannosaminyltransferase
MTTPLPFASSSADPTRVDILGVSVDAVNFAGLLDRIEAWVGRHRTFPRAEPCRQVCTVNPEFVIDAGTDPAFGAVLRRADLRVPDGVGILWAARMLGAPLPERVTGSDGIYRIAERAAQRGWRVFFLGAAPGVALHAAVRLRDLYPGLIIAGAYAGSPREEDWPAVAAWLHSTQTDILFVAYGHPKQDFWIDRHRAALPVAVALGVGGAFDFVAGVAARAPAWMQRLGLEWLHRLIRQPWRWRRMTKLPRFAARVLRQRFGQ